LGFSGKGLPFLFTAAVTIAISILTKSYKMLLAYYKTHKQEGQYNESNSNNNNNNNNNNEYY
jgi:hypothetical protein